MEKIFFYETPVGRICIGEENGFIVCCTWSKIPREYILEETELILECKKQLEEYFAGKRKTFDLPLVPRGTEFQQKVWKALQEIPYGETRTYGEVAAAIGNPKAARAVGMANNKNPIGIIIPCHRVVGANGKLVGYAGGMEKKEFLLELERNNSTC
ncbi:MAG: methylated-DNA--[protein]-cysteine S-methyltransferase [Anaerotignum sp.]|nr:methylated-DNA--[protein]-cysteine S-methyltransferase [Anaerotignum sp.]